MLTYYNDFEPFACEWIRGLIKAKAVTPGHVDERSIKDVQPADVVRFQRVHFFAGVAGWDHALNLAGWTGPVWTGSCPCQPFSAAGKRKGKADERHLWPEFFRLIRECKPPVVVGEQVASKDGLGWLDGIFADLEGAGYACGAADLCAAGVNSPHIRQRLFWVAQSDCGGCGQEWQPRGLEEVHRRAAVERCEEAVESSGCCPDGGMGNTDHERRDWKQVSVFEGRPLKAGSEATRTGRFNPWSDYRLVHCTDGKTRRISSQSGDEPLAYGLPKGVGPGSAGLAGLDRVAAKAALRELRASLKRGKRNRVGRLKGYGNAIVPQVAVEFVRAFMETRIIEAQGAGA